MKITINTTITAHVYVPANIFDYLQQISSVQFHNWNNSYEGIADEVITEIVAVDEKECDDAEAVKYLKQMTQLLPKDCGDVMFYSESEHNLRTDNELTSSAAEKAS